MFTLITYLGNLSCKGGGEWVWLLVLGQHTFIRGLASCSGLQLLSSLSNSFQIFNLYIFYQSFSTLLAGKVIFKKCLNNLRNTFYYFFTNFTNLILNFYKTESCQGLDFTLQSSQPKSLRPILFCCCRHRPLRGSRDELHNIIKEFKEHQDYGKAFKQLMSGDWVPSTFFHLKNKLSQSYIKVVNLYKLQIYSYVQIVHSSIKFRIILMIKLVFVFI